MRVAEREHGVGEVFVAGEVFEAELLVEGLDRIGGVAFAIGAGDEDGVALFGERGGRVALERDERGDVAFGFELLRDLARQAFGGAGLRGVEHGDLERRRRRRRLRRAAAAEKMPARKPLSHARCSGVNGALSGMKGTIGGCACMVIRAPAVAQNDLKFGDGVAAGEVEEGLFRVALRWCRPRRGCSMTGGQIGEADGRDQFAGEALVLVGAAADDDLVALFAADL